MLKKPLLRFAFPASLGRRPKPFFALAVLLRSKVRGGLPVRRGEGSLDLHLVPPHPLGLYLVPLRPWPFCILRSADGTSRQLLLRCSTFRHPCRSLVPLLSSRSAGQSLFPTISLHFPPPSNRSMHCPNFQRPCRSPGGQMHEHRLLSASLPPTALACPWASRAHGSASAAKTKSAVLLCVLSAVRGASVHHSCSIGQTPTDVR